MLGISRVIANLILSCTENSEPKSVRCTVTPQEMDANPESEKSLGEN